ncbi:discoidin domain-containing protein [Kitasatospora sp. NPDC057015]|uniref:discoidin domain-containing protein n=1 Tax=Kitasatospora sp. NPDC057015 TaxID=3346001 RepID=UPI0036263FD5
MNRSPAKALVPLALGLLLLASTPATAVAAAPPAVWVASGSDHVFSSSGVPDRPTGAVSLFAARNETQAAQIAVRSGSTLTGLRVVPSSLTGPAGATIPASAITVNREYNHPHIGKISDPDNSHQEPPDGGTSYYDALVENTAYDLGANTTQPYYYSVAVPAGQAPGTYTGTASVQSSAGPVDVPVSVTVYDVALPPTNRSTFRMDNWFTSVGWDYSWTSRSIPGQYGVQDYDDNWWKVMASFAADHAKHRNNVIHADFQALAIPDTTLVNGQYTFTWGVFDRFVQLFKDAGALQFISTPHLLEGSGLETLVSNGQGGVKMGYQTPGSPGATAYLDTVLPALKAHLDTKCLDPGPTCAAGRRWSDVFYMSASDEPSTSDQATASEWLYGRYRAAFPDGMSNEAHYTRFTETDTFTTTLTPQDSSENYDFNAGYYQAQRLAGKDLWLYYCNGPTNQHLNRFISYPLADSRLTPWMVASTGGNGFLHWGWNIWANNDGPAYTPADTFNDWTTGDPFLVRPNKATYGVYDSVRSEALLAGIQDYELLHQLAAVKPALARTLSAGLITGTTVYTTSGAEIDVRHKQMLDALTSPAGDAVYPFGDDFSSGSDANWRHVRGSWSVTGDQAYVQSSTAATGWQDWEVVSAVAGRAYRDVAVSADVQITGVGAAGGDTNWAGLTVHSLNPSDTQTGYLVALRDTGQVFVNRNGSQLATATVPGYTKGQQVTLRVITKGSTLKVFAGPVPLITLTDPGYPVGSVGLATGGASARFDNVRVNPATDPVEGAAVTASSSYEGDGWSTGAVTDGRRGLPTGTNGWSSGGDLTHDHTEWVSTDLGAAERLGRIDLYARADGANTGLGFPVDFTVQVSTDNVNWTTVASRTGYPRPDAAGQSFAFTPTDVRYIRVTGTKLRTDPHGNYHMQLAEIEAAGRNLALGRPVTASSSVENPAAGWVRAAATDGVTTSGLGYSMGWSSAQSPTAAADAWATVDLQGRSTVGEVRLTARTDGANTGLGFPVDFTVQVSDDNVTWTTVVSRTGYPRPGSADQVFSFTPVAARYVKVESTRFSADQFGAYYLQLGEIGVS